MSKAISLNRTDTAVSGVTTLSLPVSVLNYAADWVVKSDEPNEAIAANLTSPIDCVETFRWGMSEIKDMYQGKGINPTVYAPTRRGARVFCQLNDVWTVTDSSDATYRVDLPVEGHIVLKIPAHELVTADQIKAFLGRIVDGMFNTGVITSERISAMVRGSLLPKDL